MQQLFKEIKIKTEGQGFYNFTESTLDWIDKQKIQNQKFGHSRSRLLQLLYRRILGLS